MNEQNPTPRIALTAGEPAGIGPDLCALIAQKSFPCELVAVAAPALIEDRARRLGVDLRLIEYDSEKAPRRHEAGTLKILPVEMPVETLPGTLQPENARYVLKTIIRATKLCLSGEVQALVTGPVHKGVINDAGIPFTGHTEYIANITGGAAVMMLTCPGLRVALATTHMPLAEVPGAITRSRLKSVITTLHQDLQTRFAIERPRILVCGLNPHAGEGGHLGHEDIEIIEPTLSALREYGMNLSLPLPADTLFTPKYLENADVVLAMYHDQGLPVLKYMGFGQAVNITLGLPIIRTSVDHGTALDLAGTGKIEIGSMEAAVNTALELALRAQ
ncbi:MAG: 4-hydroxythreonine-4-phosphate dehydrogenase PdxA [Pseudomonadota bacterium]